MVSLLVGFGFLLTLAKNSSNQRGFSEWDLVADTMPPFFVFAFRLHEEDQIFYVKPCLFTAHPFFHHIGIHEPCRHFLDLIFSFVSSCSLFCFLLPTARSSVKRFVIYSSFCTYSPDIRWAYGKAPGPAACRPYALYNRLFTCGRSRVVQSGRRYHQANQPCPVRSWEE